MKKRDFLAAFIIGEACALILILMANFLKLFPEMIVRDVLNFTPIVLPALSILGIFIVSLLEAKMPVIFQAGKSFLVGILNTFIDFAILTVLMYRFNIFSGGLYVLFKGISFTGATINSYFWNKFWTFEKRETEKLLRETSQFYLITIGGLLIHLGVASLIVNIIGPQFGLSEAVWAYVGALSAVFCGFVWNFLGYKFIVFKK